jgi:hypothetical protein
MDELSKLRQGEREAVAGVERKSRYCITYAFWLIATSPPVFAGTRVGELGEWHCKCLPCYGRIKRFKTPLRSFGAARNAWKPRSQIAAVRSCEIVQPPLR